MTMLQLKVNSFVKEFGLLSDNETIVLAVSGGPDSLCLLYMFNNLAVEYNLKLVVAHLNHCLRPEGLQEASAVEKIANSFNLPCEVKAVDIRAYKQSLGVGEEEAGRRARYSFLLEVARKYGASKIATGHHRDDQAETVLLNIIRGSSLDGLSGILPIRKWKGVKLIRPLLCLWRVEIESYCRELNLKPFTDSSNLETDYKRNKLRLELIPLIEARYNPKIREGLAGLADLAARDRHLLQSLARLKYIKLARFTDSETIFKQKILSELPLALRGRVVYMAIKKYLPTGKISRTHVEQVLRQVMNNKTGQILTLPGGLKVEQSYDNILFFFRKPQERKEIKPDILPVPGRIFIGDRFMIESRLVSLEDLSWPPCKLEAYLDYNKLPSGMITVRSRKPGDRFFPQGAGGSKKLKDFLIDQKIQRNRRDLIPVVAVQDEIIWLAGVRIAEPYRITEETDQVLLLQYKALRKKIIKKGGLSDDGRKSGNNVGGRGY
ncbi:MAG: tRNA lysidine(34) synthetase TilS [Firmicutes bacterium]|nr:tRNA lysidine(34) synthetase TilS [Bacillota bacterium]